MENQVWKTGVWDTSWEEIHNGKYSEEGNCSFSATQGAELVIPFGDLSKSKSLGEAGYYAHTLEGERYSHLYGITQDGFCLALCDAHSFGVGSSCPGGTYESFKAPTVLCSRHEFNPRTHVSSINFEIDGMHDWMGFHGYCEIKDNKASIDLSKASYFVLLFSDAEVSIELRCNLQGPKSSSDGINFALVSSIHIEYATSKSLDEIWQGDLWKLQTMFGFLFGFLPSIHNVRVCFEGDSRAIEVFRVMSGCKQSKGSLHPAISFSSMGKDGLTEFSQAWLKMPSDIFHATEMLVSLLGDWNTPFPLKLFSANTMLESLMRSITSKPFSAKEICELIKPMMEVADDAIKNRAQGLLMLLAEPSYGMLLDEAYKASGPWGEELIPDWPRFKREQRELRTTGAHGLESENHLGYGIDHYYAQIILAYYIILLHFDAPEKVVNGFEESSFLNVARWRIKQDYAKPEQ